jgi:hypothetical protein
MWRPSTTVNPPKPEVCAPDMGSTLQAQFVFGERPSPEPPPEWDLRLRQGFDWDGDGSRDWSGFPHQGRPFDWDGDGRFDSLTVADDRVVVSWAGGSITVTGVQTDYVSRPATADDGKAVILKGEEGRVYGSLHVPAAVGDVTGDGWPDLVASHGGHTAVLIGRGPASSSVSIGFEEMGRTDLGWRSEPVRDEDEFIPSPVALVSVIWDFNGDGANDFVVSKLRGSRSRTGPTHVFFAGVPCRLP